METTALCDLPEYSAIEINEFVEETEKVVANAAKWLAQGSQNCEVAVFEIIKVNIYSHTQIHISIIYTF